MAGPIVDFIQSRMNEYQDPTITSHEVVLAASYYSGVRPLERCVWLARRAYAATIDDISVIQQAHCWRACISKTARHQIWAGFGLDDEEYEKTFVNLSIF